MRCWWWLSLSGALACSGGSGPPPGPATLGGTGTPGDESGTGEDTPESSTGSDTVGSGPTSADETESETAPDPSSTGELPPPDYAAGTWEFENISNTAAMSLHPRRVTLDNGQHVVGWAETEPDDLGVLNIFTAAHIDDGWPSYILTDVVGQNTYPTMTSSGGTAYLAWSGQTAAGNDYDIYLAQWDGSGWDPAQNLTDVFDPAMDPTNELKPVMVRRPGGLAVGFTVDMGLAGSEVWVVDFLPGSDPTERELIIPEAAGTCTDLTGAGAADGIAHFVARCGSDLVHATDRSGAWDYDALAGTGTGILSPDARRGTDGDVHLVWIQSAPCGVDECDDVYYTKTTDGVFGPIVNTTESPNLSERLPTVGQDPWGRVLVFSQVRLDGVAHLRMTVSEDGDTFAESWRITPEADPNGYESPNSVSFDKDGLPSVVFLLNVDGSDPLNLEVYLARFVP